MSSTRNAPDWFGGAPTGSDVVFPSNSKPSKSSGHRRSKSSSEVAGRTKKSKHHRSRSREVIGSVKEISKHESKSKHQTNQSSDLANLSSKSRYKEESTGPDYRDIQQNTKKNLSFFERIFGTHSKADGDKQKESNTINASKVRDVPQNGPDEKNRSSSLDYDSEVSQLVKSNYPVQASKSKVNNPFNLKAPILPASSTSSSEEEKLLPKASSSFPGINRVFQPIPIQTALSRSDPVYTYNVRGSPPLTSPFSSTRNDISDRYSEMDDILTYSDDDASSQQFSPKRFFTLGRIGTQSSFQPYPQQNNRQEYNEFTQVTEQNKLMDLAPGRTYQKDTGTYGSFGNRVNEFYMSEDDTSTLFSDSYSSRRMYDSLRMNLDIPELPYEEEEQLANDQDPLIAKRNSIPSEDNRSQGGSSGASHGSAKKRDPAPPISQVKVHNRNASVSTATTAGTTPPDFMLGLNRTIPTQSNHHHVRLSRKEGKKILRKIEIIREKEEQVGSIVRQIHPDALKWSHHAFQNTENKESSAFSKTKKTQDIAFTFLFAAQLCVVTYFAICNVGETTMNSFVNPSSSGPYVSPVKGFHPIDQYNDDPFTTGTSVPKIESKNIHVDYLNAFQLSCITGLYSTALSALSIGMMMILGTALIPTVLCLSVMVCVALGTIGIALSPYSFVPVIGIIALAFTLGYSIVVWDRIPFAATNLNVALCGVKSSADILLVTLGMMLFGFLWTIDWVVAFLGIYDNQLDKLASTQSQISDDFTWVDISIYAGMLISYFWTLNVIMNIVHVTIAGVIATWWTSPDSLKGCCNHVLRESFYKSITSCFGSICLGSLVTPPLEILRGTLGLCFDAYVQPLSNDPLTDLSVLADMSVKSDQSYPLILPDYSSPLDGIIRCFNNYGFTYVGIYGESFTKSSRTATDVFKARKWGGVVSDKLIPFVLSMMSIVITLGSGCFGLVVEEFDGYSFTNFHKPTATAFLIGCAIGIVTSSVCMKVVSSSVCTILVCFSLAPFEFKVEHQDLSEELRKSWGGSWLDDLQELAERNRLYDSV